jgi:quinone-modifying oxidoreductase, subunit QmoC
MKLPAPSPIHTKHSSRTGKLKTVIRRIKFESELDLDFGESVAAHAYGQKLLSCIQCGTCSATCPLSHYMDYTPRRIIAMTREGFKEEVLNSLTIWLCASCYACTVQCPRQIHITDVMYTLKREAIARGYYPRRHPIPVLAHEFFARVRKDGRNTESRLLFSLYAKTNPFVMIKEALLGIRLFFSGRMSLKRDTIAQKHQLRAIMRAVNGKEGGRAL